MSKAGKAVGKSAGGLGLQLASESIGGLSALAHDGSELAGGAVRVASVVGEMVAADALGAVDTVSGDTAVSDGLREASRHGIEAASVFTTRSRELGAEGAGILVSGLKDNVQMIDSVGRELQATVGRALEAEADAGSDGAEADGAEADAAAGGASASASAVSRAPPLRPFAEWWDVYGGALELQGLEGVCDACSLRLRAKLGKMPPSQRSVLERELTAVEALLLEDDEDEEGGGEGGGGGGQGGGGGGGGGAPPTDRLLSHVVSEMEAVLDGARLAIATVAAECTQLLGGARPECTGKVQGRYREGTQQLGGARPDAGPADDDAGGDGGEPTGCATAGGEGEALAEVAPLSAPERLRVARAGVGAIQAHASQCMARICAVALRALAGYAARCKREADTPSEPQPGATLEGEPWLHGLDWPFVSELERAKWKGACLRAAAARARALVSAETEPLLAAAREVGALVEQAESAEAAEAEAERTALRGQLKALRTSTFLDRGAADAMLGEAAALSAPVLSYVALGDC